MWFVDLFLFLWRSMMTEGSNKILARLKWNRGLNQLFILKEAKRNGLSIPCGYLQVCAQQFEKLQEEQRVTDEWRIQSRRDSIDGAMNVLQSNVARQVDIVQKLKDGA